MNLFFLQKKWAAQGGPMGGRIGCVVKAIDTKGR